MLIATFSLPHDAIALEHAFQELPELQVEAERIAAHSRAWVMPCLWTANTDFDATDDVLAADPSVEADADSWQIRIRFVSRDQFDEFRNALDEQDTTFQLRDLTEPGSPPGDVRRTVSRPARRPRDRPGAGLLRRTATDDGPGDRR